MPCRSDYMEPTEREIYCQNTAKLYRYALIKLELVELRRNIDEDAANNYASFDYTSTLCRLLSDLKINNVIAFDELVYNAKDKDSRALADWWEKHEEVDRKRKAREQAEAEKKELIRSGLSKLTKEEIKALGITYLTNHR